MSNNAIISSILRNKRKQGKKPIVQAPSVIEIDSFNDYCNRTKKQISVSMQNKACKHFSSILYSCNEYNNNMPFANIPVVLFHASPVSFHDSINSLALYALRCYLKVKNAYGEHSKLTDAMIFRLNRYADFLCYPEKYNIETTIEFNKILQDSVIPYLFTSAQESILSLYKKPLVSSSSTVFMPFFYKAYSRIIEEEGEKVEKLSFTSICPFTYILQDIGKAYSEFYHKKEFALVSSEKTDIRYTNSIMVKAIDCNAISVSSDSSVTVSDSSIPDSSVSVIEELQAMAYAQAVSRKLSSRAKKAGYQKIVLFICKGYSPKQIIDTLAISNDTYQNCIKAIRKLFPCLTDIIKA